MEYHLNNYIMMNKIFRRFSGIVPREKNEGFLKRMRDKWFKRPVVFRILVFSSALLAGATIYVVKKDQRKRLPFKTEKSHYYQPSEILESGLDLKENNYYLVGIVKEGSLKIDMGTLRHTFILTDFIHEIKIIFVGLLPDMCREGETARVKGEFVNEFNPIEFIAEDVEGNHDAERVKTTYQVRSKDITLKQRDIS